jgi:glutathione synthase/RimK-type ligase-like ATP-grasp enzyme
MSNWIILVDSPRDFDNASTPHKVITTKDYLARPRLFQGSRPKVINLARSFAYQTRGYYASLLGEARGHRVIPTVETMVDLANRSLYAQALPELEDSLVKCFAASEDKTIPPRIMVYFGVVEDHRFDRFARLLFDWYRAPILEVTVEEAEWLQIKRISAVAVTKLKPAEQRFFQHALHDHTRREWRSRKDRIVPRYSLAALHDPKEELPPSSLDTLRHFSRVAEKLGVEIEPIQRKDLGRLAEFDGLFIRETTSIDNHTYRFARRAMQEGMPVIDDPISMIRCTNKVYLNELMEANGVPVPRTLIIAGVHDVPRIADELGFPMVLKVPDSSFSRGVKKVDSLQDLRALVTDWLKETDLLLAQSFMPTSFDWRVGVLGGKPLFVCKYKMARRHWQIVKHRPNGAKPLEGGHETLSLTEAPPAVIDIGLRAASLIGGGLYGVDIKETPDGFFVVEVNDNPNIEHGIEDAAEKDQVWVELTKWFVQRIDA